VASLNAILALALVFAPALAIPRTFGHGYFIVDATSRLFLALINLIFFGISTYVWNRVRSTPELATDLDRFIWLALGFSVAGNLAVLSNHLIGAGSSSKRPRSWQRRSSVIVPALEATGLVGLLPLLCGGLSITLLGFAFLGRGMETSGPTRRASSSMRPRRLPGSPRACGDSSASRWCSRLRDQARPCPDVRLAPETYEAAPPAVTASSPRSSSTCAGGVFRVLQVYRAADQRLVSWELIVFAWPR